MTQSHAGASRLPPLQILAPRDPRLPDDPPGPVAQTWLDGEGRLVASAGGDCGSWWMHWPDLGLFRFGPDGPVRATPAREDALEPLRDSYLRGVVPVVLLARGYEAFHASAVADHDGVVMLCARSGTGKSTTAAAVAGQGFELWADDTVLYRVSDIGVRAVRLPFTSRLDDPARRAIEDGAPGQSRTQWDPGQWDPGQSRTPGLSRESPLRRVYVLTRDAAQDPSQPAITRIAPSACVERLLAHAHPFEIGGEDRRRAFVAAVLAVARRVDVWECRFGPSLDHVPALARALRLHAREPA